MVYIFTLLHAYVTKLVMHVLVS